jgi:ATP-dependent DNA ligase
MNFANPNAFWLLLSLPALVLLWFFSARKARLQALARAVDEDEALSWEFRPGSRGDDAWRASCPILPDDWVSDANEAMALASRIWAAGGEGVMIKDAEAPYRRNRNAAWQKVKQDNYQHWSKAA